MNPPPSPPNTLSNIRFALTESNGLLIFSITPIDFPEICARCGEQTHERMAVKVLPRRPRNRSFIKQLGGNLFGTEIGHLIKGIELLKTGSVRVPCCSRCRRPFYIG